MNPGFSEGSLVAQLVKNLPAVWQTWVRSLGWEDPQRRERLPTQYSGWENSMDCIVHGVSKSWTCLSDFHFHFQDSVKEYIGTELSTMSGTEEALNKCSYY